MQRWIVLGFLSIRNEGKMLCNIQRIFYIGWNVIFQKYSMNYQPTFITSLADFYVCPCPSNSQSATVITWCISLWCVRNREIHICFLSCIASTFVNKHWSCTVVELCCPQLFTVCQFSAGGPRESSENSSHICIDSSFWAVCLCVQRWRSLSSVVLFVCVCVAYQ